jgi:ABC-type branched-subunit amino acid transport system ATPase component/ABC-type branched-subunit amino acid transport system permease subunit
VSTPTTESLPPLVNSPKLPPNVSPKLLRQLAFSALGLVAALVVARLTEFETPLPVIALGSIIGITYGLLAVGLVLVYRSNRIINFAHGEVGAFAAAIFGLLTVKYGLPYYVILPLGLLIGAATGATAEVAVVRRLRNAPKLMSIVATLGIGQFLVVFGLVLNSQAGAGSLFPQPPWLPVFELGALRVTQAYTGMLVFGPVAVVLLAIFLKYSRYGLAIRSAAANPEAARMAGIPAARMSALAWALAGALSAFTAILTAPTRGFTSGETFGPGLLLRALAAAVLARMNSLPIALAGGLALGVIEQLLLWNRPQSGLVEVVLFAIILLTLLIQKQRGGREEEKGSWAAVQALRPIPVALKQLWIVRNLGLLVGLAALAVALVLPMFISNSSSITMVSIIGFAIVGLSVGIITGLGGQLSLGQFAIAAVGAWASYEVSSRIGHFELSFLYAGLAGALASLIIGLPALRIRGLFLTVTTLSFALVMPAFILQQGFVLGDGVDPGRPVIGDTPLDTGKLYYLFALPVLVLTVLLARNVRNGGFGRLLTAVRDNEEAARAFTVRASLVKTQGFLLAGFFAGVGGALYGHALSRIGSSTFPTSASIAVVVMTVIGGLSLLSGPIIGALFIIGVPAFLPLDSAGIAASNLGQLLIIMYLPAGLGGLAEPIRDKIVKALGRRAGIDVEAAYSEVATAAGSTGAPRVRERTVPVKPAERLRPPGSVLLQADGLVKSFGGVRAVRGVSFDVRSGETVGLIGPNGAGKTTTFELLGGFTKADAGRVVFEGQDVTSMGPEARGQLGMIRSFQDAGLFPTLTVEETIRLSLERLYPTRFFSSIAGLPGNERQKQQLVDDLLGFMGLHSYRTSQIQQLSTGTRRITEIACLVALQPTLLLLDEPSSGIAQRETEALGQLLVDLKEQLQLSLLIIEHDIPMIMRLSDRIVAMADGEVIASGTPEHVRNDPAVVEAYLGGDVRAIERSDSVPAQRPEPSPVQVAGGERELVTAGGTLHNGVVVPGLGQARTDRLLQAFGSLEAVRQASPEQIAALRGFGPGTARRVLDALR